MKLPQLHARLPRTNAARSSMLLAEPLFYED
jgi:hypothetical protein